MAQFREGQRVRGPNGETGVVRNGQIVVEPAARIARPADPRLPHQTRREENEADASEFSARREEAAARREEALARKAEADIAREAQRGEQLSAEQQRASDLIARYRGFQGSENTVNQIERLYRSRLENGGGVLGFGEDRNLRADLPLAPTQYEEMTNLGRQLINEVKRIYGMTGQEGNAAQEVELRFGPYLPAAGDPDNVIESKIAQLRSIIASERATVEDVAQRHGIELPDLGNGAVPTTPNGNTPAPPPGQNSGSRIDPTQRHVTAAGDGQRVEISRGDEAVDEARTRQNRAAQMRLTQMLKGGVSDSEIRSFAQPFGINVDEALDFRAGRIRPGEWNRWTTHPQTRDQIYPFRDQGANRQMGTVESLAARATASPVGTAIGHMGNAVVPASLTASLLGEDPNAARMAIAASARENPISATIGTIGGATTMFAGGSALANQAGRGLAATMPRLGNFLQAPARYSPFTGRAVAGDVAYGSWQGAGENGDPLSGATESGLAGIATRMLPAGLRSILAPTGGPSLGQAARGSVLGDAYNVFEEAMQSVPFAGRMIRNVREAPREAWRRDRQNDTLGFFNQADPNVPAQLPPGMGAGTPEAHRFVGGAVDDAYNTVRSNLDFAPDADWATDLTDIRRRVGTMTADDQAAFNNILTDSIERRLNNGGGRLSGEDFKAAASEIGRTRQQTSRNRTEFLGALEALDDALHAGATRHSTPEAIAALRAADAGYSRHATIQDAARRRLGSADEDPANFTPFDVLSVGRQGGNNRRRFNEGRATFYDEARQGRMLDDVLPSSGTSERTASMNLPGMAAQIAAPLGLTAAGGAATAFSDNPENYLVPGAALGALPFILNIGRRNGRVLPGANRLGGWPTRASGMFGSALMPYAVEPEIPY